jgi:phage head maturation protease
MNKPIYLSAALTPESTDCTTNRAFSGVAYTGAMIENHGWLSNVIIDIDSMTIEPSLQLLLEHDTSRVIGTATASKVDGKVLVSGLLVSAIDDDAQLVCQKAQAGISWQMSVGLYDYQQQELIEGQSDVVNGLTVEYPATIIRNAVLREVSVVALGADSATSLAIFSRNPTQKEDNRMEVKALQEENATLKAQIEATKAQLEATNVELSTLKAEFAAKKLEARTNEVKALFAAIGKEATEDAIKPYLSMDSAAFSVVSADMQALKPKANAALFAATTQPAEKPAFDPSKVYGVNRYNQGA